jgi:ketosteroid isomerase-like protein
MTNLDVAKAYLHAIESRDESVDRFFTPDVVQHEFPNRILPNGATRDLAALREARERGKGVVAGERYEVVNTIEQGDELALEVIWTATLAVAVGPLPAGAAMRAHFGVFFTFRGGRIASQRNYDCFDPF